MTPDQKLALITRSLKHADIDVLVMGGHAVRYYGVDRNTADFDLVTSLSTPDELRLRLPRIESLGPLREEPVWRSRDFARFEIGRLPDGRALGRVGVLAHRLLVAYPLQWASTRTLPAFISGSVRRLGPFSSD